MKNWQSRIFIDAWAWTWFQCVILNLTFMKLKKKSLYGSVFSFTKLQQEYYLLHEIQEINEIMIHIICFKYSQAQMLCVNIKCSNHVHSKKMVSTGIFRKILWLVFYGNWERGGHMDNFQFVRFLKVNLNNKCLLLLLPSLLLTSDKKLWHSENAKYFLSEQDKAATLSSFWMRIKAK